MNIPSLARRFVLLGTVSFLACGSNASGPSVGPASATTAGGAALDGSAGAGGSGGGSSGSDGATADGASQPVPIDPAKKLADLTRPERGELCDWSQNMLGGYGGMYECGGGIAVGNAKDQEECAATPWPSDCTVTVAELEICVRAQAPSHGCIRPRECDRIIAC